MLSHIIEFTLRAFRLPVKAEYTQKKRGNLYLAYSMVRGLRTTLRNRTSSNAEAHAIMYIHNGDTRLPSSGKLSEYLAVTEKMRTFAVA